MQKRAGDGLRISNEGDDPDFEECGRASPAGDRSRQHFTGPGAGNSSKDDDGFAWIFRMECSDPLPARSNGLDNRDGSPDARLYIEMRVVQQDHIGGADQGDGETSALLEKQ